MPIDAVSILCVHLTCDLFAIAKFLYFLVMIRYDGVYLTCSKKLTGSQLSLPHGINKKLKFKTKNKMVSVIVSVQSRYCEAVQKLGYGFLFAFRSNYGHICSRL